MLTSAAYCYSQMQPAPVPFRAPAGTTLPQVTRGSAVELSFSITGSSCKVASAGSNGPTLNGILMADSLSHQSRSHQPARQRAMALPGGGGRAMRPPRSSSATRKDGSLVPLVLSNYQNDALHCQRSLETAAASAAAAAACDWRVLVSRESGGRGSLGSSGFTRAGSEGLVLASQAAHIHGAHAPTGVNGTRYAELLPGSKHLGALISGATEMRALTVAPDSSSSAPFPSAQNHSQTKPLRPPPHGVPNMQPHASSVQAHPPPRRNPMAVHCQEGGLQLDGTSSFGSSCGRGSRPQHASSVGSLMAAATGWAVGRGECGGKETWDGGQGSAGEDSVAQQGSQQQMSQQFLVQRFEKGKERERERQRQREVARRAAAQRLLDDPVAPTNALAKRGEFVPPSPEQRLKAIKCIHEHFRGSEEDARALKAMLNTARARRGLAGDAKMAVVTGGNRAVKASLEKCGFILSDPDADFLNVFQIKWALAHADIDFEALLPQQVRAK